MISSRKPAPRRGAEKEPSPQETTMLVALFNQKRYAEMEAAAQKMTVRFPNHGMGWKAMGTALLQQGRNEEALTPLQKAAELSLGDAQPHNNLGNTLVKLGRLSEAEVSLRRALELKPNYAEAHYNLGNTLRKLGRLSEAETSYRRALELKPDFADAHSNLGDILHKQGRLPEAEACLRQVLELKPDFAEAHCNLSSILYEQDRHSEAENSLLRALEINPEYGNALVGLGFLCVDNNQIERAEESFLRALKINPEHSNALVGLGQLYQNGGQMERAEELFLRVLKINPEHSKALFGLGSLYMDKGQMERAEEALLHGLKINPNDMEAHCLFTQLKKVKVGDASFAMLVDVAEKARNSATPLPVKKAVSLHFALGKCYDDSGEYEKAFPHFLEGCKLKRATLDYNSDQTTQEFAEIMRIFDQATIDRLRGAGNSSHLPIFILGMPRSGTTMIEQIIASHPDVHGAGELRDLMEIAQRNDANMHPDSPCSLDQATLAAWGTEYVAGLQQQAPDMQRITDKMPANFLDVGLIHLMLPNAKIIHVNRNPVDTCLSCFTHLFTHNNVVISYDLAELGRYYVDYARLMEHWRKVLPVGAFLDVSYEDVVADQEAQTRRMIEYCGLEWNDACLNFHKNKRAIQTASVVQVRQPMYKSSVERWRHYEKFLGPLLDALGDLAPKRLQG